MDSLPSNNQDIVQAIEALTRALDAPVRTFINVSTNGTGSRSNVVSSSGAMVPGTAYSYTSPSHPVTLLIIFQHLCAANLSTASRFWIADGSTRVSLFSPYNDSTTTYNTHTTMALVSVAANTSKTYSLYSKSNVGTLTYTNATTDVAESFAPTMFIFEFKASNV